MTGAAIDRSGGSGTELVAMGAASGCQGKGTVRGRLGAPPLGRHGRQLRVSRNSPRHHVALSTQVP